MGVRREREKIYRYQEIYNSLKFFHGKNVFKFYGKTTNWEEIEIISRIFYKKLEELLYGRELIDLIHEKSLKRILEKNNLLDKTFFDVIKERKYHLEAVNILVMHVFDYIYYHIKRELPYIKVLSQISNSVSELLENTYKYTSGEFCITTCLKPDQKNPLIIKIENSYNNFDNEVKSNLEALQRAIDEINSFEDPNQAFMNAIKTKFNEEDNEEKKQSRLGFAKIRIDTNASIKLTLNSTHFGEKGITIVLAIPIKVYSRGEIIESYKRIFTKN
ncbi:MAG TPA: hypothetical protein PLE45_01355 [Spirochaetota bacterium]|nr:hypothetical protein [Spirochaetota bacterium]HOL56867.1 hypothetical protein [Spirochaetota bacterium]HPP03353.1 hypothetical protein [Spirochaetota bacterium]